MGCRSLRLSLLLNGVLHAYLDLQVGPVTLVLPQSGPIIIPLLVFLCSSGCP